MIIKEYEKLPVKIFETREEMGVDAAAEAAKIIKHLHRRSYLKIF